MLNINPETVCFIIAKAREFQSREGAVMPDSPPDNGASPADHADDHTLEEVRGAINELDDDALVELVALMWLGRADYTLEEWDTAVAEASDARSDHTAEYLLAHPQVAFYLEEGLAGHGYACE